MDGADDMTYFTEEARLKSFTSWPYEDDKKCNKRKMAEAGFHRTGGEKELDLAECFLCGKQMDGWEESDDPWQEHKSHASYCLYAQIGKPEAELELAELIKILVELKKKNISKSAENMKEILNETYSDFEFKIKLIR